MFIKFHILTSDSSDIEIIKNFSSLTQSFTDHWHFIYLFFNAFLQVYTSGWKHLEYTRHTHDQWLCLNFSRLPLVERGSSVGDLWKFFFSGNTNPISTKYRIEHLWLKGSKIVKIIAPWGLRCEDKTSKIYAIFKNILFLDINQSNCWNDLISI